MPPRQQSPKTPQARVYIDPSKIPAELMEKLQPGGIRTADDLTDFAGMVLRAMLEGNIPPQWSKILRDWAGLMFTNIASKGALAAGGNVNFNLLQVIQNAEQKNAARQVVDTESSPAVTRQLPVESPRMGEGLLEASRHLGPPHMEKVAENKDDEPEAFFIDLDFSEVD